MKVWAKFVACFLIAWLPLLGYPAQAALCPMAASVAAHQQRQASHASDMTACEQPARHHTMNAQAACHGGMGGLACGVPAIPARYAVIVVPSAPVYWAVARTFTEQFIPELPAPPPRLL
ncbi:hypothetical protein CUJ90_29140 [Paraburkholderia terricola]|jgi:hypothetical protein|uniref:Lipoprotein n=2 Tax=Paraburkholderia terricola TaxID=169427 RepID=A0A1M6VY89_9BURK|nr:hypothetical protein CUJ90_29140 [Paraburkholderia terricola]SDP12534.1 hypothetical protein SAMN05192547_104317 [Paraburkholderia sediminicola]SHK86305.1 hypothetical protein SAMN05192548_104217 [Paraburkholderia terricola]